MVKKKKDKVNKKTIKDVNDAYQKFHDAIPKNISSTEIFSTKIPDELTHRFVVGGCLFLIFCICLAFLL